jgi:HEAT repeat protein
MELSAEIQALLASAQEEERLQGVRLLVAQGLDAQGQTLLRCLGDASWRVRKEASELFLEWPGAGSLAGEVIELLHAHDNAGLRNAAVEILIRLGRQAVPALLEELHCSDADVRKFVLDVLGDIDDDTGIGAMVAALGDADQNVRSAAAENLGKLRAAAAIPALLTSMESGDLWFRFTILAAIAQIGAPMAVEPLLRYREDPLLRKALFDCLGKIGGLESLEVLGQGLLDRMRNVRAAAALALVRIGRKLATAVAASLQHLPPGPVGEALSELLQASDPEVRFAAIQLLRWWGRPSCAPQLLALLDEEALRQPAAEALIALGPAAAEALLPRWTTASARERTYLAYLFGQTRLATAAELLAEALSSPEAELRMVAAQGLGRLESTPAFGALLQVLADEVPEVREQALTALIALGRLQPLRAIEALSPLLEQDEPGLRLAAVRILGRLDGPMVLPVLQLGLKDASPKVRGAAVQALASGGYQCDLSALRLALTDEDAEVRRLAVVALGGAAPEDGLALLDLALQDDDIWVRAMVVRTLGRFGAPAVRLVELALSDPVGLVAIAALETLAELSPEESYAALVKALQHPDQEVVTAALQLLGERPNREWLPPRAEGLLNHPHWEVRSSFVRILAELEGTAARGRLEARFLVEGEDMVREQIRQVLAGFGGEG